MSKRWQGCVICPCNLSIHVLQSTWCATPVLCPLLLLPGSVATEVQVPIFPVLTQVHTTNTKALKPSGICAPRVNYCASWVRVGPLVLYLGIKMIIHSFIHTHSITHSLTHKSNTRTCEQQTHPHYSTSTHAHIHTHAHTVHTCTHMHTCGHTAVVMLSIC